jgi:hypothetical protein
VNITGFCEGAQNSAEKMLFFLESFSGIGHAKKIRVSSTSTAMEFAA